MTLICEVLLAFREIEWVCVCVTGRKVCG